MQGLRTGISCFMLLAGVAAVSLPISASAAPAADQTVCGIRADGPKIYPNARAARADGARVMHPGDCDTVVCSGIWPKVALGMHLVPGTVSCGMDPLTHQRVTYPNVCAVEASAATWIHAGPCHR